MIKDIVIRDNLCAGCGLCESVFGKEKITIELNHEGFLRPVFKNSLTSKDEIHFKKICPGITAKHVSVNKHDSLWGPYISIKTGYANSNEIRYLGSSGGGLTAIASYLLDQKKVDCVLHIGASIIEPYRNEYKVSRTSIEVLEHAGSRYAPSATLINLVQILKECNSLAIIGKPCDIVAVRNFMNEDLIAKEKIKYLLSFMCAGVPSQKGTQELIDNFNVKKKDIVSLKYRGEGWPGYFKIEDKNKKIYKMTYNESWGTILNRHLQFRCKICADGTGEFSDITFADAWESSEDGYPSFEERKGKSLIIIRNNNGEKLISEAVSNGYLSIDKTQISSKEVAEMQPYQKARKQYLIARLLAIKLFRKSVPNYNSKTLIKASLQGMPFNLVALFKNFLGMIKRLSK
jgi:coenzyme F420 hydrogenase subunit beta